MFLFRKKKENSENKPAEATKAELLRPDKSQKKVAEKARGKTVEAEGVVETIETSSAESPVKVVVPASALKEEEAKNPVPAAAAVPPSATLPDEVVDSLLKPGHPDGVKPVEAPPAVAPVEEKKADPPSVSPKPDDRKAVKEGEGKDNMFSSLFGKPIEEEEINSFNFSFCFHLECNCMYFGSN